MRFGEICGGGEVVRPIRPFKIESTDEGDRTTTYHRRTHVGCHSWGLEKVKSCQTSWIAVKVQEYICVMPRLVALEKSDLFNMFIGEMPQAIVSLILDTDESQDGSGSAASLAEFNEIGTIIFLQQKLRKSELKYEDTTEITRDAFRMFSGDIKANEFKTYVEERTTLPSKEIVPFQTYVEERNKLLSKKISFQDANYEAKRKERTREEISGTYNRETQIWCGGWDSQLRMQSYGFNWIAVQGEDSVCVVTQDTVGTGVLEDLSYLLKGDLFGRESYGDLSSKRSSMMSPFAVVSVVLSCCDEVDAESCDRVSTAEIDTVKLLAKQMDDVPIFTYELTVKTAIAAFMCLAWNDRNVEKIKVYTLRKGKLPVTKDVTPKNIMEHFLKALPKSLMDTE